MSICPQCGSKYCGDYACRFYGRTHKAFRANEYATKMSERDRKREWRPDQDLDVNGRPLKAGS